MSVSEVRDLYNEAQALLDAGEVEEAVRVADRCLLVSAQVAGESHYATGYAACLAGRVAARRGDVRQALDLCERAASCAEANEAEDFENAATILAQAADLLSELDRHADARRFKVQLLVWHEHHLGAHHPRYQALRASLDGQGVVP